MKFWMWYCDMENNLKIFLGFLIGIWEFFMFFWLCVSWKVLVFGLVFNFFVFFILMLRWKVMYVFEMCFKIFCEKDECGRVWFLVYIFEYYMVCRIWVDVYLSKFWCGVYWGLVYVCWFRFCLLFMVCMVCLMWIK